MLEVVQPKIEASGVAGSDVDEAFMHALGVRDYTILVSSTDALIMHVDRTVASLVAIKDRLHGALARLYPQAVFIKFEPLKNPPKSMFSTAAPAARTLSTD